LGTLNICFMTCFVSILPLSVIILPPVWKRCTRVHISERVRCVEILSAMFSLTSNVITTLTLLGKRVEGGGWPALAAYVTTMGPGNFGTGLRDLGLLCSFLVCTQPKYLCRFFCSSIICWYWAVKCVWSFLFALTAPAHSLVCPM
jgi:hypothetical protein